MKKILNSKKGAFTLAWLGSLFYLAFFVSIFVFIVLIFLAILKFILGKTTKGLPKNFKQIFKFK